jgi:uncharacterized protein with HEPN domain
MAIEADALREMRDAVDAVIRYTTRGCSGTACDRARGAWMGNQLGAIGVAAAKASDEVRDAYPDIPWAGLAALADEQHGVVTMTADEMQRFVERELPQVRKALRTRK